MTFTVGNQAKIANKYVRFVKWKIRKISSKFANLTYSEIYIRKESDNPVVYNSTIIMGVPGPDIIISSKAENLDQLWSELSSKMKRQLRKYSTKRKETRK